MPKLGMAHDLAQITAIDRLLADWAKDEVLELVVFLGGVFRRGEPLGTGVETKFLEDHALAYALACRWFLNVLAIAD